MLFHKNFVASDLPALEKLAVPNGIFPRLFLEEELLTLLELPALMVPATESAPAMVPLPTLATLLVSDITFFELLSRKDWASATSLSSLRSSRAASFPAIFSAYAVFASDII